jgi:hypothetical protein
MVLIKWYDDEYFSKCMTEKQFDWLLVLEYIFFFYNNFSDFGDFVGLKRNMTDF